MRAIQKPSFLASDTSQLSLHLHAIDVLGGCVVSLLLKAQYAALNYIWGNDQSVKLRTDDVIQLSSIEEKYKQ